MNNLPKTLPFPRSYWAAPGKLLAGCYPGDPDAAETRKKLAGLVSHGVSFVLDLMHADEKNYAGQPFVDYRPALEEIAREAGRTVRCERLPIRDNAVPSAAQMRKILDTIDAANAVGEIVFVHCWGGKGRTGTVVGCYLARHGLATGEAALTRLNELAKTSTYNLGYVPQTDEPCDFVRKWKEGQ